MDCVAHQLHYEVVCMYTFTAIRIGFSKHIYEIDESTTSSTVKLVKEDNIMSEQTFSIEVHVQPVPINLILPAIQFTNKTSDANHGDYSFSAGNTSLNLQFPPSIQVLHVNLTILDDVVAEGTEAFVLHSSPDGTPSYYMPIHNFQDTKIIIKDNDSKYYLFTDVADT